ncbi:2-ketocyclohexanecarboxyl-CoA hydrolase [Streptomyces albus]|uniref:2-ketocyclohexanecarboxyl-CoA hydrolase n=1 Tax=Streptomyces albus (strain ATCC 21838 / DSM 41398 / FERM P-419 / JCM 4703 / NBRC 107858) TaxID=1081613 RepID=A0A0B5EM46_STRA4|nr:2-ketocyclohexanecarboxyl-CoA hydrolase [Streptomyces albus]AOU74735.1 2-ketocyclohexanecarboxyl-CoA hydrolase [Streptomyces albus]AYN30546.1 enoyl-CoA hydratase [Streptomyces albus]
MPDSVLYEVSDGVAVLTLNRPEALNALDIPTKTALRDAVLDAQGDPAVRAVLLTAAGERAFCVGQDLDEHMAALTELRPGQEVSVASLREHLNPLVTALLTMPKPVVAGVNGIAAGAGASLAWACDVRVLAERAGFNTAFAGVGLTADTGASWTLPRLVGHAKAAELLMVPRTVPAAEAHALGLANQVVPGAELREAALDFARKLAAVPASALGAIKESLAYASFHSLADTLAKETALQSTAANSAEHLAAMRDFTGRQQRAGRRRDA